MTDAEMVKCTERVAELETDLAALKILIYEGKPPAYNSLLMLSQMIYEHSRRLESMRQDIQNIQINDKKAQNNIFYMLILLFVTMLIRFFLSNDNLIKLKDVIGL